MTEAERNHARSLDRIQTANTTRQLKQLHRRAARPGASDEPMKAPGSSVKAKQHRRGMRKTRNQAQRLRNKLAAHTRAHIARIKQLKGAPAAPRSNSLLSRLGRWISRRCA